MKVSTQIKELSGKSEAVLGVSAWANLFESLGQSLGRGRGFI